MQSYWHPDRKPHICPDSEWAEAIHPNANCCDDENKVECICVTEEDVLEWDKIKSLSAIDFESLSNLDLLDNLPNLVTSSVYWNESYDILLENSGKWNDNENNINSLYEQLSAVSSSLNELVIPPHHTNNTIAGVGSIDDPYRVNSNLVNQITSAYSTSQTMYNDLYSLHNNEYTKNWLSLDATSVEDAINPYISNRFINIENLNTEQSQKIYANRVLIDELLRRMNGLSALDYDIEKGLLAYEHIHSNSANLFNDVQVGLNSWEWITINSGALSGGFELSTWIHNNSAILIENSDLGRDAHIWIETNSGDIYNGTTNANNSWSWITNNSGNVGVVYENVVINTSSDLAQCSADNTIYFSVNNDY